MRQMNVEYQSIGGGAQYEYLRTIEVSINGEQRQSTQFVLEPTKAIILSVTGHGLQEHLIPGSINAAIICPVVIFNNGKAPDTAIVCSGAGSGSGRLSVAIAQAATIFFFNSSHWPLRQPKAGELCARVFGMV